LSFDGSNSYDPDNAIVNYSWDFGDGTNGAGMYPSHSYDEPGNYTVTLIVKDSDGFSNTSVSYSIITTKSKQTPGFEIICLIIAIGLFLLWTRKRKKNTWSKHGVIFIVAIIILSGISGFKSVLADDNSKYSTIGTGVSHEYNGIPFEIYAIDGFSVYHIVNDTIDQTKYISTYNFPYKVDKIHFIIQGAYALHVPNNVIVGNINAYYSDGSSQESLNLISGVNIAEWAYDRAENQELLKHSKIQSAYSFKTYVDSSYSYFGHFFYVSLDVDDSKSLSKLELILYEDAHPDPDWYKIDIHAITLEDDGKLSPIANAGDDISVLPDDVVDFIGIGEDTDGYIEKFEWDFDGDGTWDWTSGIHGITVHQYPSVGLYTAKFRVTDDDDLSHTDTRIVEVCESTIDLHIFNLDDDDMDIAIYVDDRDTLWNTTKVLGSGKTLFTPGILISVEPGTHDIFINYTDPDLGSNDNFVTADVNYGEQKRADLYTIRCDKSDSNYDHYARKIENEDIIRHSFIFPPEKVELLANDTNYSDFIAGKIIEDIDKVQGKFFYSDLGVQLGKFIAEDWISDDLSSSAPDLKNTNETYQYGTYELDVSTSQTLQIGISVLDFAAMVWRSAKAPPELKKFLGVASSIACTIDFFGDRVDEWKYDDDIDVDIIKFANDVEPLIELALDCQLDVGKTIIINIAKEAIEFTRPEELVIKLDGATLNQADDYDDIMDPTNEDISEYFVNGINEEGAQIIVSIPSFSEHAITIMHSDFEEEYNTKYKPKVGEEEENKKGIPGFEFIFIVCALAFILYLRRKKQKL